MKKPATTPIDPREDIVDQKTRETFLKASALAKKIDDSPEAREDLAQLAQDHLIALRALQVPYNGRGIALQASGDVYVYGVPCHPRDVAEKLAAGDVAADLTDLVHELKSKLDYEASTTSDHSTK